MLTRNTTTIEVFLPEDAERLRRWYKELPFDKQILCEWLGFTNTAIEAKLACYAEDQKDFEALVLGFTNATIKIVRSQVGDLTNHDDNP